MDKDFSPPKRHTGSHIPYDKTLIEKARENRRNPTPAEQKLWFELLQGRQLDNLKFTRQKPLDSYIVDFFCSRLMLAIEVDGDSHSTQLAYDENRTQRLNSLGIEVIRYANTDIINNIEGVYQDLYQRVADRKLLIS